ncbi:hypothetical protein KKF91_10895 [Myxococcota bacterium]|nr:hypothetical protein [Myxococcota bacterium]MBU1431039.1 hypothetical protein [Myxococcota bacterium]MBU1898626.1 hypothetical protein [Myxococcota bacterium]
MDDVGRECKRAELNEDGSLLLLPGMTGQGYYDDGGRRVSAKQLEARPSTRGEAQLLIEVGPRDLLDHRIEAVYQISTTTLDPTLRRALEEGRIFQMPFSLRGGHRLDVALLLCNDAGAFVLVGRPTHPRWCTLAEIPLSDAPPFDDTLDLEVP